MATLDAPITALKGVGQSRASQLKRLGILTMRDAIFYLPRDYQDLSNPVSLRTAAEGEECVVLGTVQQKPRLDRIRVRGRITIAHLDLRLSHSC